MGNTECVWGLAVSVADLEGVTPFLKGCLQKYYAQTYAFRSNYSELLLLYVI